ncbi:hypothetical protein [uncultured Paraglaciecola sp.]|uniref:hypothetical protein n=1 Tax=uncultured Paraglaciecola sp. TaxID=1765024 RepID=UPI00259AD4EE|nr:hypothetical protein [uncultured Paraglaciecola sp.]
MIVFTSINTGYLDKALVLAESVKRWHPDASFHIVLADYKEGNQYICELVDHVEFLEEFEFGLDKAFLFQHNVVELCTLVKPIYAAKLANNHKGRHIVYLDPDTMLFSPMGIVVEAHSESDVLLTPHLLTPPSSHAHIVESEYSALQHGLYNLGFFSCVGGDNASLFFNWWGDRLKHICSTVKENGLFTDQKIVDIAPIYFNFIGILKSKSLNVATWNLFERPLVCKNSQFFIENQPLVFYHFTGFDSGAGQRKIDQHHTKNQALEVLWQHYHQQLSKQSTKVLGSTQWCFANFEDGQPIPNKARQYFRYCVENKHDFPNPFSTQFQTLWANSIGARLFERSEEQGRKYLKSISTFSHAHNFDLKGVMQQLQTLEKHHGCARVFLWGYNEYAQQVESTFYAQSMQFEHAYVIDKNLPENDRVIDPTSSTFLKSDIIVVCAISAKNDILSLIKTQKIPAHVLSIG